MPRIYTKITPTCHPDEKHGGRGYCVKCFNQLPDVKARHQVAGRRYYLANKEKVLARTRAWHLANPDKTKESWKRCNARRTTDQKVDTYLRHKHGVTLAQYQAILADQNGVCAICGGIDTKGNRLEVDHSHETGQIRGLLCHLCNMGLGSFRDNTTFLEAASLYLKENNEQERAY